LELLPSDSDAHVTAMMLSAKKKFHQEAQEVRTPARVLFSNEEDKSDEFVDISMKAAISRPLQTGLKFPQFHQIF
jgi:hypothetical protein